MRLARARMLVSGILGVLEYSLSLSLLLPLPLPTQRASKYPGICTRVLEIPGYFSGMGRGAGKGPTNGYGPGIFRTVLLYLSMPSLS